MKNLVIDFGNTLQKLAVFSDGEPGPFESFSGISTGQIERFIKDHGPFDACILASVISYDERIRTFLSERMHFLELDHTTSLPVRLDYETPETLGKDRIALACAAHGRFQGRNVLVIGAGTAITYDLVDDKGTYQGGAISPGMVTRFRALHTFTGKLPLVELTEFNQLVGKSTEASILSGVINGTVEEIDGIIRRYEQSFDNLEVILTGGDHKYLADKLKSGIFALPNLVLTGLNEILRWNAHQ